MEISRTFAGLAVLRHPLPLHLRRLAHPSKDDSHEIPSRLDMLHEAKSVRGVHSTSKHCTD